MVSDQPDFDFDMELREDNSRLFPWQELYPTLSRKPIRLSYSTNNLVESCARKFQIAKDKNISDWDLPRETRENNEHLDFGSAIGIGAATLLTKNSLEAGIWAAISNFNYANETATKNAISLVTCLQTLFAQWNPDTWEIAQYNGKPAAELSFKVILDQATQDYYCGYVDLVLIHKPSKLAVVLEVKSTGIKLDDLSANYQNSAQGLGYSVILDSVTGGAASWQVLYLVFQFKGNNVLPTLHILPFKKTLRDRLEWLLDLRILYSRILSHYEMNYWPKRSSGCLFFNKACPFIGTCDQTAMQHLEEAWITKEANWDFVFSIEELINRST
jgi:hypothetical protein